jgi:phosphoglycerol transferase
MTQAKPRNRPTDRIVLILLVGITLVSWCTAHGKWSSEAWRLPTVYLEPVYSDFLGTCAMVKSSVEGGYRSFLWKSTADLGAPSAADHNTQPMPDEALVGLFGLLAKIWGLFPGFNFGVLLGHLATVVAFYLVGRSEQCSPAWAGVAALAFGLAPYLFAESPHHINCQYVWHIPLFLLVWKWIVTEPGIEIGSRRFWNAAAIGLITGLQNPYYTFVFAQLTLLGAAVLAWRQRSQAALVSAAAIVGAAAFGFLLSNLDTISYRLVHGSGGQPIVTQREYRWMDIYGFKVVDLFIPSITHHSEALAQFGLAHRQASVLNDEEGCAYLGIVGIMALFLLGTVAVRALLDSERKKVPLPAWQVLWIVLFFNTGGINSIIAAFTGFTLFRTACRYSIVILAIVLLYAAQRLSAWQENAKTRMPADQFKIATLTPLISLVLLILWDQVPRSPTAERQATIARQVEADREFVARMEESLPPQGGSNAMVFQLPVMDGSPAAGVAASDHYRPYLYSVRLHFSHGAAPGSDTLRWQLAVQQQLIDGAAVDQQAKQINFNQDNVRKAIDEMLRKGFAAIYINRNGFPDRGKGLEEALLELGYDKPPIRNATGDLVCIVLKK